MRGPAFLFDGTRTPSSGSGTSRPFPKMPKGRVSTTQIVTKTAPLALLATVGGLGARVPTSDNYLTELACRDRDRISEPIRSARRAFKSDRPISGYTCKFDLNQRLLRAAAGDQFGRIDQDRQIAIDRVVDS